MKKVDVDEHYEYAKRMLAKWPQWKKDIYGIKDEVDQPKEQTEGDE